MPVGPTHAAHPNRKINIALSESEFNVFWRALHDREKTLQLTIDAHSEESEQAVVANNDIIYLRAVKASFEKKGKDAGFRARCFDLSDEILDLSKM